VRTPTGRPSLWFRLLSLHSQVQRIISWYYYIRAPWYMFSVNENNASVYKGDIKLRF
jgi:hypothetical protein